MRKSIDISLDFQVVRYKGGVKFLRPENFNKQAQFGLEKNDLSLKTMHDVPFNFFINDRQRKMIILNENTARSCDFDSVEGSTDKYLLSLTKKEIASCWIDNNELICQTEQIRIVEEEVRNKDGISVQGLGVKIPWYDDENRARGILGFSINLGEHPLAKSLEKIAEFGFLLPGHLNGRNSFSSLSVGNAYITRRESNVLNFLRQGYTAKAIAKILSCSPRTIEKHVENIKHKFDAHTKSELIYKLSDSIF